MCDESVNADSMKPRIEDTVHSPACRIIFLYGFVVLDESLKRRKHRKKENKIKTSYQILKRGE